MTIEIDLFLEQNCFTVSLIAAVITSHSITQIMKTVRKAKEKRRPPRYQSMLWGCTYAAALAPMLAVLISPELPDIRNLILLAVIAGPNAPLIWWVVERFLFKKVPTEPLVEEKEEESEQTILDKTIFYLKK